MIKYLPLVTGAENDEAFYRLVNGRNTASMVTQDLQEKLFGDAGSFVSLTWVDEDGSVRETSIERAERSGRIELGETLPPIYVEFESKQPVPDVRYIRFNAFVPPVDECVREALEGMGSDEGLIIDLRGNPGGVFSIPPKECFRAHL
jgi:C-terminal processing protease CtpA/Prc